MSRHVTLGSLRGIKTHNFKIDIHEELLFAFLFDQMNLRMNIRRKPSNDRTLKNERRSERTETSAGARNGDVEGARRVPFLTRHLEKRMYFSNFAPVLGGDINFQSNNGPSRTTDGRHCGAGALRDTCSCAG